MLPSVSIRCILFIFYTLLELLSSTLACPRDCFCNRLSKIVYCSGKGLKTIPENIPKDTNQLNVNENKFEITTLKRDNFTHFKALEHLYLSDCGIRAIEVGAFIDLVYLKWLDLSNNDIKDIQDFSFRGLNLQQLFLNGNEGLVMHEDTFIGLKTHGLYLQKCGLSEFKMEILRPLKDSLTNLWINDNRITRLKPNILSIFSNLTHLRLHSNPLHCNCKMKWLKRFYDTHLGIFDGAPESPGCATPANANGRGFSGLKLTDFKCLPPSFNDVDILFSNDDGILSCSASGDPAPILYWIKPTGSKKVYYPSGDEKEVKTDAVMRITHVEGIYTGAYECVASNEGGNVSLNLNVSWPRIQQRTVIQYIDRNPQTSEGTQKDSPEGNGDFNSDLGDKLNQNPVTTEKDELGETIKDIKNFVNSDKKFTMVDLVTAILGTFLSTLIASILVIYLLCRTTTVRVPRNRFENGYNKPSEYNMPKENLYLDNRHDDEVAYMDIRTLPKR